MRNFRLSTLITLAGVFCAILLPTFVRAQVVVDATVTFNAGTMLYTYAYSITNPTAIDLALVEIPVIADPATVQSLVTPTGYQGVFDSGLGLVDFLPDLGTTGFAPGSTVSGFAIVSPFGPNGALFSALDSQGNSFVGNTFSPNVVPEPGTLALGLTALTSGLGLSLRAIRRARKRA